MPAVLVLDPLEVAILADVRHLEEHLFERRDITPTRDGSSLARTLALRPRLTILRWTFRVPGHASLPV